MFIVKRKFYTLGKNAKNLINSYFPACQAIINPLIVFFFPQMDHLYQLFKLKINWKNLSLQFNYKLGHRQDKNFCFNSSLEYKNSSNQFISPAWSYYKYWYSKIYPWKYQIWEIYRKYYRKVNFGKWYISWWLK